MNNLNKLAFEMINYFQNDPKRTQHLIKVHALAKLIADAERVDKNKVSIIEAAAYIHDIGIKPAEAKYKSSNGKLQEELGPEEASKILNCIGFEQAIIDRVCYIVGHHHTYEKIDDIDFQILVEADLLANFYEDKFNKEEILVYYDKIFKTETGIKICEEMFGIN